MSINLGSVIDQLEEARRAANEANQRRYEQGLRALRSGRESLRQYFDLAQQNIQNIGQAATEEIDRSARRNYATGRQGLISAGLGNTTITSSLQRGVEDDRQRQLRAVDEQRQTAIAGLAERRAGAEFQTAGAISDFIAARDDIGPNVGLYSSLIEKAQSRPGRVTHYNRPAQSLRDKMQARQQRLSAGNIGRGTSTGFRYSRT
jgi:hypothetical protein